MKHVNLILYPELFMFVRILREEKCCKTSSASIIIIGLKGEQYIFYPTF